MTYKSLRVTWEGPYGWPGFESICSLKKLPDDSGVYLLTFKYKKGYLIYFPGESKSFRERFKKHQYKYLNGKYFVFDIDSVTKGIIQYIWKGWGSERRIHPFKKESASKQKEIIIAVCKQLAGFRIFIVKLGNKRIRQRLEAALIEHLESLPASITDRGMWRSTRKEELEKIIVVRNSCKFVLYDSPYHVLPKYLKI